MVVGQRAAREECKAIAMMHHASRHRVRAYPARHCQARQVIGSAAKEGLMAFLKETDRSLRLYFIVVGAIAAFLALGNLASLGTDPAVATSGTVKLAIWFPVLARLVLGVAFVIAGFTLKRALET